MKSLVLATLLAVSPLAIGTALADSGQTTPASPATVSTQQNSPAATTAPQSTPQPADSGDYSFGSGGCPFGHTKQKSAATS